ncbi:hypothetical protein M5K25_006582 [Dendrobium thyrsiflorum]|uniref:Uncharacterized protein n=1 Tax=Dendrobium thyrsiflorum TaxID=117978 RepID=A0ABD0VJ86_DENTH
MSMNKPSSSPSSSSIFSSGILPIRKFIKQGRQRGRKEGGRPAVCLAGDRGWAARWPGRRLWAGQRCFVVSVVPLLTILPSSSVRSCITALLVSEPVTGRARMTYRIKEPASEEVRSLDTLWANQYNIIHQLAELAADVQRLTVEMSHEFKRQLHQQPQQNEAPANRTVQRRLQLTPVRNIRTRPNRGPKVKKIRILSLPHLRIFVVFSLNANRMKCPQRQQAHFADGEDGSDPADADLDGDAETDDIVADEGEPLMSDSYSISTELPFGVTLINSANTTGEGGCIYIRQAAEGIIARREKMG